MYDKMVDGEVTYMCPIVQLEAGSTFNMYGGTVEHWMHPDSASNRTPAYCPTVRGDGTFTVTGGTLIGAIANYVKIDGADKNHPVYIDGNCFNISGKTIRNAVIKKTSYLRELYNMENVTMQEAGANDALHWNWTGEYTLTDCNLSGVRIRCRNTDTLTMTNSTVGTVENFKKVIATNSTIQGVDDSSSGRVGVSVTEAILTGSTVGGPITADNITLTDTKVTGTVTAPATGKITVGGSTTVTDLYLKNGQKFYVNDLSNDAKINVRSEGAGDLIANPPGSSLEGKVTTSSGELSFSDDGQVTIVPSLDHEGKSYTALVQGSSEWTGTHQYYLTQDWTGSITIPSGANVTLCLHAYDFTGNITVQEGGTLYLEVESTWYNPKSTIYGQIVNNGTLELRKVGWTVPTPNASGYYYGDYNCIDVNSGSKTAIVNNGTLTWHCHNKSYVVENESLSTVTDNGTAPTIVNNGTMDGQRITVINNGAGPVLSNMAGSARLAGTLTTVGNSEAVHVSGGEVKITQVTSGASGENSAAIVAAGGSVECVHDRNGKAALSAPNAETVIRVEAGSTFKFDSWENIYDPEFGTGTKYTLVNNGGTVSIGGNNKISGVMLNKAGTMNLTNVKATGKGQVVVDGGELTVSGAAAAEDLKNDIITLNGGAVVLAGSTYKTNTGYYAVRVVNKDASLTAKGGVDMTNSAVYLCTDAKMAVLKEGDTAPRVKIVMETPGVFAENVTEDLTSTVSSANANYAVKYNATAKTLYLELTGEHKHDSTTYKQLKDTDTALTAGYYYLPQSVKMEHDLTISGDVTICLNGSTLSFGKFGSGSSDYYKVKVQDGGTLNIQDELTGGGKLTDGGIQLAPTADFTLESGTLEAKEAVCITGSTESTNTNTVTIKGGAITALWAVRNVVSGATVNVTGGTLTMPPAYTYGHGSDYDYQALIGMNGGTLTISGGTWVQENKTFGMLVGPSSTTASNFTGTVTVTGGSFTIGRRGFELYDGTASFSNVIFTTLSGNSNLSNAIRCYGNAQVKLNKVTFDTIHGVSVSDTANATLTDVTVKTYTIPADNLYLTKDITWTIKEGYDSCHRFTMNGERYLCLNGHDLALKLGTRETWSKLYSTDAARQKLTITNCAEHPSTIYGSIDLGYSGYSWDKYNPTDRLVLENLTVAGRIDMRKVKYTGEDYTTSLDHVTVTPADDFGSTVQLGAGKHIIKNSTLTYNEPDSYKDYAYGALYLENANAKVTLEGTVNITGGFGLYGRGGTVDASKLSPDSKIVLGAGKSAIYDEYKYTITGVTEELRSCFTLSNYAPTSSYKPENYRLVYDAEAQTLKIEEVETHYDKDSKVERTVSSSKYAFASGEPATLYAYWNTNDSACTLESYQWYAVDANGKKTSIPGATERTYTTDTLTPGTHKFTAVAYYTVTNSNRTYRKDATNDIIVKVNAAVDINTDGITITGFTNGIKTYDGTAVSYDGTATAEGYTGEFEYKWFKDGEDTLLTTAPKDVGIYYLKVSVPSGAAGYSGEAKIAFTISPATITVTPTANQSKVYGTADTALTYTNTGAVNSETANFIGALSRETGENVGIYAITQGNLALADKDTFKASNYTLVFSEDMGNFTVSPKMLTADMVATITDQTYTGNAIKPAITVTDSEKTLTADDYTVTYESNTNAGTATVKITGKGNYTDEVSKTFTINPKALENDMITAIDAQVYTGKAITPEPEVKYGEMKLEKGTDYTVSYESNTAVGTATVTVTAVESGNYAGSATANFTIGRADQTLGKTDMTATYGEIF